MPEKLEFARVTMPEFEVLVPENIYNDAFISLGILEKGIPCGVICASFEDYHYSITWLYIDKKKRRKGYATALLTECLTIIRQACETYPMYMSLTSMDEDLLGFFQNYEHFYVTVVGDIYNVSSSSRKSADVYQFLAGLPGRRCQSYYSHDSQIKLRFMKKILKKSPQFSDLINADLDKFDPELCLAYGKNDINAAVFAKVMDDNTIDISFMYSDDVIAFGMVLLALIKKVEKNYANYNLRIICVNDKSRRLVWKIFPDIEPEFLLQADWDLRLPGDYPAFN